MNARTYHKNSVQLDYFSQEYLKFEEDYYHYSAFDTPLVFLLDDILLTMASSQKNYFKLNKENAKDGRDHYFVFKVTMSLDNQEVRVYTYQGHVLDPYQIKKRTSQAD